MQALNSLGYEANRTGITWFQAEQGLDTSGLLDWKTILVIDGHTGPADRPRLWPYQPVVR